MATELLHKLEQKIANAVETIDMLKLHIVDLEEQNAKIMRENSELKSKQVDWEQEISNMLEKLNTVSVEQNKRTYVDTCDVESVS